MKSESLTFARVIGMCFLLVCSCLELSAGKEKNSARSGDQEFWVTSFESPETVLGIVGTIPHRPSTGHHFVVVHLKVKNLSKRAACAYFTARVKAEFGLEYRRDLIFFEDEVPHIHELLPGEETIGSYVFQVKDGVRPLELIMEPKGKQGCGQGDSVFYPATINISLEGVQSLPTP
jgi:hypothetical protein